jgi:hypothetical protein
MHIKILRKSGVFLVFSACLISGCDKSSKPLDIFVNEDVVLVSGVNFETKQLVVINSRNGNRVQLCSPVETNNKNSKENQKTISSQDTNDHYLQCNTKFVINDDSQSLLNAAIQSSQKPIQGKIEKGGKLIDATYVVVVKALFEGSNCETDTSGGIQFETCVPPRPRR